MSRLLSSSDPLAALAGRVSAVASISGRPPFERPVRHRSGCVASHKATRDVGFDSPSRNFNYTIFSDPPEHHQFAGVALRCGERVGARDCLTYS